MTATRPRFSTDHQQLLQQLVSAPRRLIIQDLDGVCMGLVRDPLQRHLDPDYIAATRALAGEFFVLSNGEHIGRRGVNALVEAACGGRQRALAERLYLPGLGGGGVQWQDADGQVSHPGVSEAELAFLAAVPARCHRFLSDCLAAEPFSLDAERIAELLAVTVLDNPVSPTININNCFRFFAERKDLYCALQQRLQGFMQELLQAAADAGLEDSFFIHYAPNLGRATDGQERPKPALGDDSGTTDFQFMLRGAIKEVGVLVILNHYYQRLTGSAPLGEAFNVREAPGDVAGLLSLVRDHFDPALMPHLVGVGDTVTSQPGDAPDDNLRGGSDRGFLTLIQDIGAALGVPASVLLIDSSGGEVRRPALDADALPAPGEPWQPRHWQAVSGISDPADPLRIDYAFPGGHRQYVDFFQQLCAALERQSD